jgi:hypothetical protein
MYIHIRESQSPSLHSSLSLAPPPRKFVYRLVGWRRSGSFRLDASGANRRLRYESIRTFEFGTVRFDTGSMGECRAGGFAAHPPWFWKARASAVIHACVFMWLVFPFFIFRWLMKITPCTIKELMPFIALSGVESSSLRPTAPPIRLPLMSDLRRARFQACWP